MHTVLQHSDSPSSHFLVAFVGECGHLASARAGGNTVDIWAPPPTGSYEVALKPQSNITLENESIIGYIITAISIN